MDWIESACREGNRRDAERMLANVDQLRPWTYSTGIAIHHCIITACTAIYGTTNRKRSQYLRDRVQAAGWREVAYVENDSHWLLLLDSDELDDRAVFALACEGDHELAIE